MRTLSYLRGFVDKYSVCFGGIFEFLFSALHPKTVLLQSEFEVWESAWWGSRRAEYLK